jgi:hypothetical protein
MKIKLKEIQTDRHLYIHMFVVLVKLLHFFFPVSAISSEVFLIYKNLFLMIFFT